MSDNAQQFKAPTCGKCGAGRRPGENGAPIAVTNIQMGGANAAVFFCGNAECGAIFGVQVIEILPQQRSPIVHPGMQN